MLRHFNVMESTFLKVLLTALAKSSVPVDSISVLDLVLVLTNALSMLICIEIGVWLLRPNVRQNYAIIIICILMQWKRNRLHCIQFL